jgi:hypothetical protein
MCHMRPFVDAITFSKPNHENVYLTEIRNVNSNKMAAFATPATPDNLEHHWRVCVYYIIRSGRGTGRVLNPHI